LLRGRAWEREGGEGREGGKGEERRGIGERDWERGNEE